MAIDVTESLPDINDDGSVVEYYAQNHLRRGPCDPWIFIDRLMTDYSNQGNVVDDWIFNMSPLYKLYKKCLQYVAKHFPEKRAEVQGFQGVIVSGSFDVNW